MASQSRESGNEGRARVCARRAAGYIAGEYLRRQGLDVTGQSAYEVIRFTEGCPGISARAKQILKHMTMRLKPDYQLPVQADLIAEARRLAKELLGEPVKPG